MSAACGCCANWGPALESSSSLKRFRSRSLATSALGSACKGEDTKTGKGRSIPLLDFELARWLKAALVEETLPTHEHFYRAFKAAVAKLGLPEGLCVHSLRHTTATRLALKVKGAQVQDFMGHGSYKTTQKYIHLTDEDRMAAAAALGA
jgi:integrase